MLVPCSERETVREMPPGKVSDEAGNSDQPITGINITPLVDIILVLLIIFMVTATFLVAPSINVDLPRATTGEPTPISNIAVVIEDSGDIFLNGKKVTEGLFYRGPKSFL